MFKENMYFTNCNGNINSFNELPSLHYEKITISEEMLELIFR